MGIVGIGLGVPFANQKSKLVVYDSFNRADNPNSLGIADTGQVWQALSGVWGILSGVAYNTNILSGNNRVVLDAGLSDYIIQVKTTISAGYARLLFRLSDDKNEWMLTRSPFNVAIDYELQKRVNGVTTLMGTFSTTPQNGDILKVICKGDNIQAFINDINVINLNDDFNGSSTKCGFGFFKEPGIINDSTFDNFTVEDIDE